MCTLGVKDGGKETNSMPQGKHGKRKAGSRCKVNFDLIRYATCLVVVDHWTMAVLKGQTIMD
jgi:hypothetical protein